MRKPTGYAAATAVALYLGSCSSPYTPQHELDTYRGFNFVAWSAQGYAHVQAQESLAAMASSGANQAAVLVTAYQTSLSASEIKITALTPTPASVGAALDHASGLGLETAIKLHVDVDTGDWRGHIDPQDPGQWFASYQAFVMPWAAMADSAGVDLFMIGTELAGTLKHQGHWLNLIAKVRETYRGKLVYAASWDEITLVPFWGEMDAVGVDAYFPVARRKNPSRLEILAGWQPWISRMRRTAERYGKPVILTEAGYRSVDGAGLHPYEFASQGVLDLEEQADLYWAVLETAASESWIAGVYFWNWPADGSGGPGNRDYTPIGKPAMALIEEAWLQ